MSNSKKHDAEIAKRFSYIIRKRFGSSAKAVQAFGNGATVQAISNISNAQIAFGYRWQERIEKTCGPADLEYILYGGEPPSDISRVQEFMMQAEKVPPENTSHSLQKITDPNEQLQALMSENKNLKEQLKEALIKADAYENLVVRLSGGDIRRENHPHLRKPWTVGKQQELT